MPSLSWVRIIFGLITIAIATVPLLALFQVIPSRAPAPGDTPNWIGVVIMLAFLLGGTMMVVNGFLGTGNANGDLSASTSLPVRAIYRSTGVVIAILLAIVLTWVAFGPGERQFVLTTGPVGHIPDHAAGGHETSGRIAFGIAAVATWLVIGACAVAGIRRWLSRR